MQNKLVHQSQFTALRLETLIRIRWLAVIGQSLAVIFVYFLIGFKFAIIPCAAFIALSAILNLYLRTRYAGNTMWQGSKVTILLGYDILQLALLLYLTGGLENPFAILLVVPVIISAATQRAKNTIVLICCTIAIATFLMFFHEPLPWYADEAFAIPIELKIGIWVAIVATMVFTAVYTFSVADESRKMSDALAATELILQREQHVSNLDGLAAAAAHELGTPLATIALVSKEMLREVPAGSNLYEDTVLLRSQADRCREILKKISSLSSQSDENISRMSVTVLIEETVAPYRDFDIDLEISQKGNKPTPRLDRNAAILYGLGNIVENAFDFAKNRVDLTVEWNEENIVFTIEDDGDGFPAEMLERIGEPFVTSRTEHNQETGGGLGLGVFIAKTLLERNGASLVFSNKQKIGQSGARVIISWKRKDFEKTNMLPKGNQQSENS